MSQRSIIPILPSKHELRSHPEPLGLRWLLIVKSFAILLVIPPCPAVQDDLLTTIFRRRNWYYSPMAQTDPESGGITEV